MTQSSGYPEPPYRHYANETALVGKIWKAVEADLGDDVFLWGFKVHGSIYQTSGIPDLLLCVQGRLVGIEVKNPGVNDSVEHMLSRVTFLQWQQIDKINRAGGVAGPAWTVEMAILLARQAQVRGASTTPNENKET